VAPFSPLSVCEPMTGTMTAGGMPPAFTRHPYAARLLRRGLLDQVQRFADFEERLSLLEDPVEQQKAFEAFVQGVLVTGRLFLIRDPMPLMRLSSREESDVVPERNGLQGIWQFPGGAQGHYQAWFAPRRQPAVDRAVARRRRMLWLERVHAATSTGSHLLLVTNLDDLDEFTGRRPAGRELLGDHVAVLRGQDFDRLTAEELQSVRRWLAGGTPPTTRAVPSPAIERSCRAVLDSLLEVPRATVVPQLGMERPQWLLHLLERAGAPALTLLVVPSLLHAAELIRVWNTLGAWNQLAVMVYHESSAKGGSSARAAASRLSGAEGGLPFPVLRGSSDPAILGAFLGWKFYGVRLLLVTHESLATLETRLEASGVAFHLGIWLDIRPVTGAMLPAEGSPLRLARRLLVTLSGCRYDYRRRDRGGEPRLLFDLRQEPDRYGRVLHLASREPVAAPGVPGAGEEAYASALELPVPGADGLQVTDGPWWSRPVRLVVALVSRVEAEDGTAEDDAAMAARYASALYQARNVQFPESRGCTQVEWPADMVVVPTGCGVDDLLELLDRLSRRELGTVRRDGEPLATLLIPVGLRLPPEWSGVATVEHLEQCDFTVVWTLLAALLEVDAELGQQIRQTRMAVGRGEESPEQRLLGPLVHRIRVLAQPEWHGILPAWLARQVVQRFSLERDEWLGRIERYRQQYGHLHLVADGLVVPEWKPLVEWVAEQRRRYAGHRLEVDHEQALVAAGLVLDAQEAEWQASCYRLQQFHQIHGHCIVPKNWPQDPGLALWVEKQRRRKKLGGISTAQEQQLDALGFLWTTQDLYWEQMFVALTEFRTTHGHCNVPEQGSEYQELAWWVSAQRKARAGRALGAQREERLDRLGLVWDADEALWQQMLLDLQAFRERFGHLFVPRGWRDHPRLAQWVWAQRAAAQRGLLPAQKLAELEALGFVWDEKKVLLEEMFLELARFRERFGHCNVPRGWSEHPELALWVASQRQRRQRNTLEPERIQRLDAMGFVWDAGG
jgi:hypothetical protein